MTVSHIDSVSSRRTLPLSASLHGGAKVVARVSSTVVDIVGAAACVMRMRSSRRIMVLLAG